MQDLYAIIGRMYQQLDHHVSLNMELERRLNAALSRIKELETERNETVVEEAQ